VITAVDTNVLIDILEPDPVHGPASRDALSRCLADGAVTACSVVWAEVGTAYGDRPDALLDALETLHIGYGALGRDAALEAARQWHAYRARGGRRRRIAADFLIGGHALVQCDRLSSRDRGFYAEAFQPLELLDPSE